MPIKQAPKYSLIESINIIYKREKSKQIVYSNKRPLTLKELNYQHISFIFKKRKLDQVSRRLTRSSLDDIDVNSDDVEESFLSSSTTTKVRIVDGNNRFSHENLFNEQDSNERFLYFVLKRTHL